MAGKFLRRNNTQNNNSTPWNPFAHHDEHEYLPKGPLSCEDFQKGHSKDLFLALSRKSSQEGVQEHTTMSCPETSADGLVVGAGVGASDVFHWEKILALFIAHSSAALAHPYFYLIRTNTKWSLCLLSGLSPAIYSALLLECELVSVRTSRDGSKTVRLAREKWIDLLNRHGLRGVDAEYTDGQINHSAIFDHHDDAVAEGMFTRRMPLLRVGKVRPGKSPPSNTAINRGDEPPRLSHAMRDVKMRLIESTMSLLVVNEAEREDVSAVEQWVMMTPKMRQRTT